MPLTNPRDSTIAVVGDGFGSLIVYATAVYLGFRPRGDHDLRAGADAGPDLPAVRVQPGADGLALGVRVALPARRLADVRRARGLVAPEPQARCSARRDAVTTRASRTSWPRRNIVAHKLGWNDQRYPTRVGWLQRAAVTNGDTPHFVLFDEDAQLRRPREARDDRAAATGRSRSRPCSRRRARIPRSPTGSCRRTRRSSTTRAAATSSSAPGSRRSTSGRTRSTWGRSASRSCATRRRTSRT